jgi:predicted molibdopterin-dependent oxidoreductase YjgC
VLSTGRTLYHYNVATQTRRNVGLTEKQPEAFVEIHPKDARKLGVKDGSMVDVLSRRGKVRCRAMISRQVRRGAIWMPFHFPEARTNYLDRLTTSTLRNLHSSPKDLPREDYLTSDSEEISYEDALSRLRFVGILHSPAHVGPGYGDSW